MIHISVKVYYIVMVLCAIAFGTAMCLITLNFESDFKDRIRKAALDLPLSRVKEAMLLISDEMAEIDTAINQQWALFNLSITSAVLQNQELTNTLITPLFEQWTLPRVADYREQLGFGFQMWWEQDTVNNNQSYWLAYHDTNSQNSILPVIEIPFASNTSTAAGLTQVREVVVTNYSASIGALLKIGEYSGRVQQGISTPFSINVFSSKLESYAYSQITKVSTKVIDGVTVQSLAMTTAEGWGQTLKGSAETHVYILDPDNRLIATTDPLEEARLNECFATHPKELAEDCVAHIMENHPVDKFRALFSNLAGVIKHHRSAQSLNEIHDTDFTMDGNDYVAAIGIFEGLICLAAEKVDKYNRTPYILMYLTVTIGPISLVLILLIALHSSVFQPVGEITEGMNEIARLDFPDEVEMQRRKSKHYTYTEIQSLVDTYIGMSVSIDGFSRYVPKEVVKDMMLRDESAASSREMESRLITVMFVDMAGFTSICEAVPPEDLVELLEGYFGRVTRTLLQHGCTIDKYIGDAVMGFWGAPLEYTFQGYSACCAALHLQSSLSALQAKFEPHELTLRIRIGMHRGVASVGNVGCKERISYTALGDTVNAAARLQSLNKHFNTRVTASSTVLNDLDMQYFVFRHLGSVVVKGKKEPIPVFELLGVYAEKVGNQTRMRRKAKDGSSSGGDHLSQHSGSQMSGTHTTHSGKHTHVSTVKTGGSTNTVEKIADLEGADELKTIKPVFHLTSEEAKVVDQMSTAVAYFESMGFTQAVEQLSTVLENNLSVVKRLGIDVEILRTTLREWKQYQANPPSQETFSPALQMTKK